MQRLVISAPFGNWFNDPNAISTLGTFTREYRGGFAYRLWRVLKTVRYYPGIGAWKNRLGLPNPGIDWLVRQFHGKWSDSELDERLRVRDKIVSISARNTGDWFYLVNCCADMIHPGWIELNVSCPNTGEKDESDYVQVFGTSAMLFKTRCIVKIPPVNYRTIVTMAMSCGIRSFHCCNTIPVAAGGISGAPLKPFSLEAVREVRNLLKVDLATDMLIGGGGVVTRQDAQDYLDAGATHVAVASTLFFPWRWAGIRRMAKELSY